MVHFGRQLLVHLGRLSVVQSKPSTDTGPARRLDVLCRAVYPTFVYYPRWQSAPTWVTNVVRVFASHRVSIDTAVYAHESDAALEVVRPDLEAMGFQVETSKSRAGKLFRPVFFGENGAPERQYEIDAYHPQEHIALEVEAGRATMGNAIYRDIVQMSLLVDVDYAVVAVPLSYHYKSSGRDAVAPSYRDCRSILEAIYGGRRLELPFKGFLLIGY